MRAYPDAYLSDVVENQGKLFDLVAQKYPGKDTAAFINAYMRSKTPMSSTQGQFKISYQKDDITKVAKNLNASEKSLKKAHFNRASLRSPFSDIDFEQN